MGQTVRRKTQATEAQRRSGLAAKKTKGFGARWVVHAKADFARAHIRADGSLDDEAAVTCFSIQSSDLLSNY